MHARKACLLTLAAFCFIGARALPAKDGATPKAALPPQLELVSEARLNLSPVFTAKDSFVVRFRIAVPTAEKYQRHRCLIGANQKGFTLTTSKTLQWMLRGDTLMVLSEVEMTLRAPQALANSLVLDFKFTNLDRPKQPTGTARLFIGKAAIAPAPADSVTTPATIVAADSTVKPQARMNDSSVTSSTVDSTRATAQAEASSDIMPWILIGLLLSGFAVMALLSVLSRRQSREATDKIVAVRPLETNKSPHRDEHRPVSFENMMRRREQMETPAPGPNTNAGQADEKNFTLNNAVPAASVLALTPAVRGADEITALPDLQSALAQLCVVTAEVQKAVGKQFEALQQLSTQVETARRLPPQAASLQNQPRLQFAFEANDASNASAQNRNALGDLGVRVSSAPEVTEKYEEIADAIASLAAASTIKPPPVSAQALAPKLELLQRIHAGLQALATFCRENSTGVAPETVESLNRRVLDLRMSYETWASDQNLKLPLLLQRPAPGSENARRKIVESLLDGLYETRKLAAQGGLYFERRLAQLLEQDFPKLRAQFSESTNAELRKILEGIA